MRESLKVLQECAELQQRKSRDYQNENSRIQQADYYPRGVASLMDIINTKTLRLWSVIEAMESDPEYEPNFESLEDSFKDLINYASFGVAYCRGKVPGQTPHYDFLNREIKGKIKDASE
jgi:hypothetical protein